MEIKRKKLSPMLVIFLTVFIDLLGFGIIIPLSPYYTEHFGGSALTVGLLSASYSLMQFVFAPIWGRLSDRVGRRPIILISILGGAAAFFSFAAAGSLAMLFFTRALQGMFGANISTAQAYVADISTKENRSKAMGMVGAAFGLGFIFGPAIGAKLSEVGPIVGTALGHSPDGIFGMGFPGLVSSALCLLNFILAYFILPESLTPEVRARNKSVVKKSRWEGLTTHFRNPSLNWLLLVFFLATFAMTNMESTLALFTEKRLAFKVRQTGELFAYVGIVIAFTQGYLIRKFLPKFGEGKVLVAGSLLGGVGLILTAFAFTQPVLMFTLALLALGSGMSSPAILGSVSLAAGENVQGEVMGVTQSLGSLARIFGPITGGYLFSRISSGAPYWLAGMVMISCGILVLINFKNIPQHAEGTKPPGFAH